MVFGIDSLMAWVLGLMIILIIFAIIVYIYSALTLMIIARRTNTENAWMALVPFLNNYLMSRIAKMHWWPILLLIIPTLLSFVTTNLIISIIDIMLLIVFMIFNIIWTYKICEARNRPGWWAIIALIPIIGFPIWWFIMFGILAWGKE
jgi:hypothetical protein